MIEQARQFFLNIFPEYKHQINSVEKVNGGFSNYVFKIETPNKNYKVRLTNHNQFISRKNEKQILEIVGDEFLLYFDDNTGNSIYKWIAGRHLLPQDFNEKIIEKIVELSRKYHESTNNKVKNVIIHDHLEHFEQNKKFIDDKYNQKYLSLIKKHQNLPIYLTHNDINGKNLIYSSEKDELFLIDYEWGRQNTIYWEFGNFIRENQINDQLIKKISEIKKLDLFTLKEHVFIATHYALQLSYCFEDQDKLKNYQDRLNQYLKNYFDWIN